MTIEEADIAIIGAGPSGLIAAREASLKGVKVIVLEEHEDVGLPCHCAGLLSVKGLNEIGIPLNGVYVQNKVKGARFFSPSGLSFTVERKEHVALVIDRYMMDNFLAEQSRKYGAQIMLGSRVENVKFFDGRWTIRINGRDELRANLLIDAEGSLPKILKTTDLKPLETKSLLKGLQADVTGVDVDPNYVEVHLGRRNAPGFFAWVIPLNSETVRVGLACRGSNQKERLFKFVKERFRGISGLEMCKFRSGLIITCGPIRRTYSDNLLVTGDAAGQVKPITGGGVIFGGICASIAGRLSSKAIKNNKMGRDFLRAYEEEWKSRLGREFKVALIVRRIMNNLSDKSLDRIFSIINEEVCNDLSVDGDMDLQGETIIKLVRKKKFLKFLPSILKSLLPP